MPTVEEFKALILTEPLSDLVQNYIFSEETFAFREMPNAMGKMRNHLRIRLNLSPENIIVVGSGKLGFSLNPFKYFQPFSDASDLDVVVVDDGLFDQIWFNLLDWHYLRRYHEMNVRNRNWAGDRKKDIYWGWLRPDQIKFEGLYFPGSLKQLRDLSTDWFDAFRAFGTYDEFASRDVVGRLYRTWDHALRYHLHGLRELKETVESIGS